MDPENNNNPESTGNETTEIITDDDCCPICLGGDPETMVSGPCQHDFCIPCLERVLTSPSPGASNVRSSLIPSGDSHLNAPTLGRCPICRSEMSLFDLKKKKPSSDDTDDAYAYPKDRNIANSKLQGMVFIKNQCMEGNESIHFPSSENGFPLPYLNLEKVPRHDPHWKLDDGSSLPDKKYFEPGCHFHEQTRTFHGTIRWGQDYCRKRLRGSPRWDFILSFSSDFRYIARGVFIARKESCQSTECGEYDCKFSLDGTWKVTWPDNGTSMDITVHGNKFLFATAPPFQDNSVPHAVQFTDPENPTVALGDQEFTQTSISGVYLRSPPHGPALGESIGWAVSGSSRPEMIWTRQSMSTDNSLLEVAHFGPDHVGKRQYQRLIQGVNDQPVVMPTYHSDTIWGNTLCQALTVGMASYHFMSDESAGAYISYEHERTAMWPPLDNGMPVPARMWFREISFDAERRIFRGTIDWFETHGTTWQGNRLWKYEMHFAEEYTYITGGAIRSVTRDSEEQETEMSVFGEELVGVYVNGGLLEQIRTEAGSDDTEYRLRIVRLSSSILERRLQTQGASARAMSMIQHLLMAAQTTNISYPSSLNIDD
jgi:hypothetical protein